MAQGAKGPKAIRARGQGPKATDQRLTAKGHRKAQRPNGPKAQGPEDPRVHGLKDPKAKRQRPKGTKV